MTRMLDLSMAITRREAPPPPIAKLIGFDLVSVAPGEAVVEFQAMEAHAKDDFKFVQTSVLKITYENQGSR
jgi:acyl-coenzyme A thioesterase PaaI-like protein